MTEERIYKNRIKESVYNGKIGYAIMRMVQIVPLVLTIVIFSFVLFGGIEPFWQGALSVVGIVTGLWATAWTRLLIKGEFMFD